MNMPKSICDDCPVEENCDYPCVPRVRNLAHIRTFESKLKRRVAKGIARSTGVPWKSDLVRTSSNHVTKVVLDFLRAGEPGK